MPSKKQSHRYDKDSSTQPRSRPTAMRPAEYGSPAASDLSHLQRTIGNRATGALLKRMPAASPEPRIQRALEGAYADAYLALVHHTAVPVHAGGRNSASLVVQRVLTGEHAQALQKLRAYMGDAANAREQVLQEAQDLGFRAPNLPGHMSRSGGKDDAGEKERQKQINAVWDAWVTDFAQFKRSAPAATSTATKEKEEKKPDKSKVFSETKQTKVKEKKDAEKKQKKEKKRDLYEDYVDSLPPGAQGKANSKDFAAWKKQNGYF